MREESRMTLCGKKLMFFGGSGLDACAIKRAKELGITTIVCNRYSVDRSPAKAIADEAWTEDFSNTDRIIQLIRDRQVDGIFVGWTDSHLPYYAEICERAGLPCCGTPKQFGILSNNKKRFKELCGQYDVPVVKDYPLTIEFRPEQLAQIQYPVVVKPADGSGGRGVKRCDNESELKEHYCSLYESGSKNIICEAYIDSRKEIFLNYTIVNSECHLAATYMCYDARRSDGRPGPAILHVYPSSFTRHYQDTVEPKVIRMLQGIGLKNAVLSLQGFVVGDGFVFHETGLRMGGGQSYVFTRELNGLSALDQMLEYSVTGRISEPESGIKDNPYFTKCGVNYYISLRKGRIHEIKGYEAVRNLPQVLQISSYHKQGDVIEEGTSLDSVIYRLHVLDDTPEQLAKTLQHISHTLCINDEEGHDMQVERLTYDRALNMIQNS